MLSNTRSTNYSCYPRIDKNRSHSFCCTKLSRIGIGLKLPSGMLQNWAGWSTTFLRLTSVESVNTWIRKPCDVAPPSVLSSRLCQAATRDPTSCASDIPSISKRSPSPVAPIQTFAHLAATLVCTSDRFLSSGRRTQERRRDRVVFYRNPR